MLQRRSYSPVCDESDPEAVCARQAAGVDNVFADEFDVLGGALYRSEASRSGAAVGGGGGGGGEGEGSGHVMAGGGARVSRASPIFTVRW